MNQLNLNNLGFSKSGQYTQTDFAVENNTLAAYLGDAVFTDNIATRWGAGTWRLMAGGYDTDGTTPLFVEYNTDSKEFGSFTWTLAGGFTQKVNKSYLKATSDDILVGGANEITSFRHKPTSWRIDRGMLFVACNVEDNSSGGYQATYMALAYSTDYGSTYRLCDTTNYSTFVSRSSDTITVSVTGTAFATGQAVKYTSTGTNIPELTSGTTYFVISQSATSFKLATSVANALAGTAITLSGDGSGTQTFTTPYIITPGSFINLTPSAGKATGQHWALTIQEVSSTRIDVMLADYHANSGSPGGTHHYVQFTGAAGSRTAGRLKQIHQVITSGVHAHIGYNKKLWYGDTSVNQSYRFSFDSGDASYEQSAVTVTQFEATASASQPVNAMTGTDGMDILAPDNHTGLVQVYDSARSRITPRMAIGVAGQSGGNESFMMSNTRGVVSSAYYAPYRATSSRSLPSPSKRAFVSEDGVAWAMLRYDADYADSSGVMPYVFYSAGVPYMFDSISNIFTVQPITFIDCTPTSSAKGGTNVLTGALTATALTDATVAECPLVGGKYTWPTGTAKAGQPISPQPLDRTSKVYYVTAATGSGDELNLDMGSTVASGSYVAKAYVMSAQDVKSSMTVKLTNTSDAAVTTWTADNTLAGFWREVNPFYSPAGTVTLRLKLGLAAGEKCFVQWVGVHSGKLPLDNHSYGTTTISDNTYQTAIPNTGTNGAGLAVSRFRLSGTVDSYFANQNSTGAIVLAEYREDANNHVQLTMTPDATVTNVSTFALVSTVGGTPTTIDSQTGWLNNRDEITFGVSRDNDNVGIFADLGNGILVADGATADVNASFVRAGSLPCTHLFSITDGTQGVFFGADLAAYFASNLP